MDTHSAHVKIKGVSVITSVPWGELFTELSNKRSVKAGKRWGAFSEEDFANLRLLYNTRHNNIEKIPSNFLSLMALHFHVNTPVITGKPSVITGKPSAKKADGASIEATLNAQLSKLNTAKSKLLRETAAIDVKISALKTTLQVLLDDTQHP